MIKENKIHLPDDFYINYSFVNDFGYTPDTEVESIREMLKSINFQSNNESVLKTLELIRETSLIIEKQYPTILKEYNEWRLKQKFISGGKPALILLAQQFIMGIMLILFDKIFLNNKKNEDSKIIDKLIKEFQKNNKNIIIEIKKTYEIRENI